MISQFKLIIIACAICPQMYRIRSPISLSSILGCYLRSYPSYIWGTWKLFSLDLFVCLQTVCFIRNNKELLYMFWIQVHVHVSNKATFIRQSWIYFVLTFLHGSFIAWEISHQCIVLLHFCQVLAWTLLLKWELYVFYNCTTSRLIYFYVSSSRFLGNIVQNYWKRWATLKSFNRTKIWNQK